MPDDDKGTDDTGTEADAATAEDAGTDDSGGEGADTGGTDDEGAGTGGTEEEDDDRPTAAEWKRTRDALAKAKDEARQNRLKLKQMHADAAKAAKEGEDEAARKLREASEAAAAEVEARYKPLVIRSEASAALVAARAAVTGKDGKVDQGKLARLLRLVDMGAVEVDDDGAISGLDDQIAKIKEDYPELFETARPPRPKVDAADKKPEPVKPKSSAEKLAASLGSGG